MSTATATAKTRKPAGAWALSHKRALETYGDMRCKYTARRGRGYVHITELRENGRLVRAEAFVPTDNQWRLGWDSLGCQWVASNGHKGWRFRSLAAMQSFKAFLARRNWAVSAA